jgi:glutamine synthetase
VLSEAANPARITEEKRSSYGITRKLPSSITEALEALESDEVLTALLPENMVKHYIIMKRAEQEMLSKMSDTDRRIWLIERY